MSEFLASIARWDGEKDIYTGSPVVAEVTEVTQAGTVEIAFSEPNSRRRHYVSFNLAALTDIAVRMGPSE